MIVLAPAVNEPSNPKLVPQFGENEPAIQRCCVRAVLHCPVSVRLFPPSITEFEDVPESELQQPPIIEEL